MLSLICQAISSVGFSVVVGLILNWKLCLVIMAFIPINFISGFINMQSFGSNQDDGKYNVEEGGRIATETIENIKTVVSLGRENYFYDLFVRTFNKKFGRKLAMIHVSGFFYAVSTSVLFFIQAATFSYGYYLIANKSLSVTNMYRIYAIVTFSSMSLGRLFAQMPDSKKARDACETALNVMNRTSKIDSMSDEGIRPESVKGEIKFKNVYFKYPNRPNLKVLNGLNLHVNTGEVNALVGQSGCGKSTTIGNIF